MPDLFAHVDAHLLPVLEELRRREPIFHNSEFGTTPADFEVAMAPDYWEVGASGRRYSREFILRMFKEKPPVNAASEGWEISDFGLRRLGLDIYLLTYTLRQASRLTGRSSLWQSADGQWRVLYHQGTIVTAEGDDVAPQHAT